MLELQWQNLMAAKENYKKKKKEKKENSLINNVLDIGHKKECT